MITELRSTPSAGTVPPRSGTSQPAVRRGQASMLDDCRKCRRTSLTLASSLPLLMYGCLAWTLPDSYVDISAGRTGMIG